jgi:hypothetical protein
VSDGSVIAVIGLDGKGRADYLYDRSNSRSLPSAYADQYDYARRQKEPRPERDDCTVITPKSAYTYDVHDTQDIARAAALVCEDTDHVFPDAEISKALANCTPGGTVRFEE